MVEWACLSFCCGSKNLSQKLYSSPRLSVVNRGSSRFSVMDKKNKLWLALSLLLSCLGIALILHYTRLIPGVGGDSVQYVMGAESLLEGKGYARLSGGGEIRPITGFPPLYSLVLAGIGWMSVDPFEGARLLNAALFGGSIFLTGLLIFRHTASLVASLIGSALVLTSLSLVSIHGMVMTEPLFIFLMLLAIYNLVRYLDTQRLHFLVISGLMVSLSTMTRYIGLSLFGAGVLSILLLSRTHWKRRLMDCVVFGGLTVVPLYFWFRRNAIVSGTAVNRELIYHPMQAKLLRVFLAEILSWFAPRILALPRTLRNLLVVVTTLPWLVIFYFHEVRNFFRKMSETRKAFWTLPWVLAFYVGGYTAILIVNSTLLDAGTTMSAPSRYLTPVFVVVVMVFVIAIHRLVEGWRKGIVPRMLAVTIGVALIIIYALQVIELVREPFSVGGYFEYKLKRMEAVREFEALDLEAPIISNNPEMIYVMSNRTAYMWPIQYDVYKLEDRDDFDAQVEATREKLLDGGLLVVFGWPEGAEMLVFDLLETERLAHFIDVSFWGYPEALDG